MTSENSPASRAIFPGGWPQRLWFLWATVVVPILSFGLSFVGLGMADWQEPGLGIWLELLLDRPGSLAFAPLAALVVAVSAAIAIRPTLGIDSAWGRVVLSLGVLLGVHYTLLVPACFFLQGGWPSPLEDWGGWAVALLFIALAYGLSRGSVALFRFLRRRRSLGEILLGGGVLLASSVLLLAATESEPFGDAVPQTVVGLLMGAFVFILLAGPIWTTDALVRLLLRLGPPAKQPVAGLLLGLAAYAASWRLALVLCIEAYQKLPETPPDCFVATAAARAPRWLSGSRDSRTGDGRPFRVSRQLQRLKLFELALRELSPGCHRKLRKIYDAVGPRLAARISTPGRAALAWLALRPAELMAMLLVRMVAGAAISRRARLLYRPR